MAIHWERSRTSDRGNRRGWLLLVLAVPLLVSGAIGLWTVSEVTFHGTPIAAKVIEHHAASGSSRMASIVAQVEVAVPRGRTFRKELEDQFGVVDWVDGGTVNVLCMGLAGDDPKCGLDSVVDLWLQPAALFVVGLGLSWWWWRKRTA